MLISNPHIPTEDIGKLMEEVRFMTRYWHWMVEDGLYFIAGSRSRQVNT